MKRCVALILVITLVALVAVLLPGCGSDTKQAKEYMLQGDKLVTQYEGERTAWEQEVNAATSTADLEKIKASANDISNTAAEAKAAYQKILSLKGVEDYAKYANLEIEALGKKHEFITLTTTYLEQLASRIASGDTSNLTSISEKYGKDVKTLTEETTKLDVEAQKLKAEKKL